MRIQNDILDSFEKGYGFCLVCCDLSAAFDTVDHEILLTVLEKMYRVKDTALLWFRNYLKDRKSRVVINGKFSDIKTINYSVPQGSLCGPVLYNLYAGTLEGTLDGLDLGIYGYADDHSFGKSLDLKDEIEQKAVMELQSECLGITKEWMDGNRLKMNDSKTELIIFRSNRMMHNPVPNNLKVQEGITVERAPCVKYLGMHLDENLTLTKHLQAKLRVGIVNLHLIRNIRKFLTEEACRLLVQALVMSHLDYANATFFKLPKYRIDQLQRLQNKAARVVFNQRRPWLTNSKQNLKRLHWLPVEKRIDFKIATLVFKCLEGSAPDYLKDLIKLKVFPRRTRQSRQTRLLEQPCWTKKTFGVRSFKNSGPEVWNKLPEEIRLIEDLEHFKSSLKTFYFSQIYN